MNNPLEAVTQAVNSLVTALKLPDESAKANEVLGEMSFPQFSRLLPYRDYNQESGLFMNDTTMGFMLEAIPINGANESIVEALDHMLRTKLPRGIPLCIHLMSSQLVGDRIEYGLREFSWSGEQAERFNAITRAYYMKAAATQFPLPEGMNLPLTLRHYRVFISYCSPSKKKSRADILEMENLVKIIRASLQGASITTQTVDAQAFIDIVGEMINHNPDSLYPKRRQLDPYSDLNYQCVEDSFDLKVRADYLTLGLRENGRNSTARILNFHLARNPEIAFLWNMADNYSNLLNPELSISCPFILTLTLVVEDQVKTHSEANLKYMDLEKKSKTSYAKWFPSVEKEAKEWGELRQRLGSGQSSVVSYFLNITAFCKDNNETALEVEQDILNSFRKNGFELISPRFNHMRNFLTCLPFMAGKGLFKQLKEAGVVQRAESFNVANLMPLVADNPLTPAGLLAPTYRNQLAFIDIFFRGMNNTNYNMAVCGTSGAGKTGLIQPLIRSVLDSGGFAVVFDMGDGYKSLCENMGGVYLDGETLRFNPFANITDIDQSAERVRDQLSVMASPNGNLDEVHEGLLLQAVKASWLAKKNQARIDDVVNFLKNASDSEQYSPRFNHMRNFLTCLPFMAGKGLFKQLKEAGVVQRAESFNVANLMPLVADNPLTPAGLLAPTYRNQLAFIDIFFRGMNNTNYNMAVCGTSGAGKTGLIQPLIRSVLDSGGFAVVFDMGDGYKSLCENMGGVYLDGETLRFNPFANITDIDQSAERVRDQLSVMASPNGNLDEVHEGLLLQAVKASWLAKKNQARIDDVVNFLKNASDSEQYAESPTIRSRLDEMIVLLDQYTANGTYGRYFNSDEPSLRDDARMVVLELGGLEDRPSLLVAVMFSLIIYIENRMYRTPRNLKKLNVIDEGWRLLDFKNHKVGEFIEKGYRTARRHTGAYITITQNIVDFDSDKASSAARAAWGNSSYKIILKQSAKEFAKYNQLYPDQFLPLQRDMIGKFGAAKDQWFSSFLLQVENHSSWHRLFVDPLSRAMYSSDGPDFEFVQQKRKEGLSIHEAVWQLAWKKSGPEMASLEAWLEEHEKYRSVA